MVTFTEQISNGRLHLLCSAFFSNVSSEMTKWKDQKFIKIVEANLFNKTGVKKLIIFNNIVNSVSFRKKSLFIGIPSNLKTG